MSLFDKIFDGTSIIDDEDDLDFVEADYADDGLDAVVVVENLQPAPVNDFTSFVKRLVLFGEQDNSEPVDIDLIDDETDYPFGDGDAFVEPVRSELDEVVSGEIVADEGLSTSVSQRASDYVDAPVTVVPIVESSPLPIVAPTRSANPLVAAASPPATPSVVKVSSAEQKSDAQVERIVDGLFDRMKVVWGEDTGNTASHSKQPTPPAQPERYSLVESRAELSSLIRSEVPQAVRGELISVVRTEIVKVIEDELARVVREEFAEMGRAVVRLMDRLHEIEVRLAKIEGSVGQEVKINFPEGAVRIDAPITIPEREVKVAAPINVQPPSVTFDEGAISVHFNKTSGAKKEVRFDRDPHDQTIRSAEIVDVQVTRESTQIDD